VRALEKREKELLKEEISGYYGGYYDYEEDGELADEYAQDLYILEEDEGFFEEDAGLDVYEGDYNYYTDRWFLF
jgi:hypothetical protein